MPEPSGGLSDSLVRSVLTRLVHDADDLIDLRRQLHARPELSFEERATTALVRDRLAQLGIEELPCPTPTGAVAMLEGAKPGRTVLLRADIDALPVHEVAGEPFASDVEGCMHACGHDAHTAALLGVAAALAACQEDLPGRYLLLFQPGEERISGAQALVSGGLFDDVVPDAAAAVHVVATAPTGWVLTRPGHLMAGGSGLEIVVNGSGGHGALQPRQGNVVLAASTIATRLHTVVEGMDTEGAACVCSPGMVAAGTAPNVVPTRALLAATLRWFHAEQRDEAMRRLSAVADEVADDFDVAITVNVAFRTGPVVNDAACTDRAMTTVAAVLPDVAVAALPAPIPASDDLSVLFDRVPGCYMFIGAARPDGTSGMHHSPTFAIDERSIAIGARALAAAGLGLALPA